MIVTTVLGRYRDKDDSLEVERRASDRACLQLDLPVGKPEAASTVDGCLLCAVPSRQKVVIDHQGGRHVARRMVRSVNRHIS